MSGLKESKRTQIHPNLNLDMDKTVSIRVLIGLVLPIIDELISQHA